MSAAEGAGLEKALLHARAAGAPAWNDGLATSFNARAVGAGDGELAAAEFDVGLGHFHQMRGDLLRPWR